METRVVFRKHDDNDGNPHEGLTLVETFDGDMWIVVDAEPGKSLRFREPNCGGGVSPRTWAALRELYAAMEADNKERPNTTPPRELDSKGDGQQN